MTRASLEGRSSSSSAIPDYGVHAAGRYRSSSGAPAPKKDARNFGPDRVSFGMDPAKPHAKHMKAKDMVVRHSMVGVLAQNQSAAIGVQQWRCAMVRNRNADCMRCADACTSGCIAIQDGSLVVDISKCVGCGTCATVCPTCALESRNPTDAALLERCLEVAQNNRVTILCHPLAQALQDCLVPDAYAEVVCLGRVDESLLVELACQGVREIVLSCGVCSSCEQEPGHACAADVVDTTNTLLRAWDSPCTTFLLSGVPDYVCAAPVLPDQADRMARDYFSVRRANDPIRQYSDDGAEAALSHNDDIESGNTEGEASGMGGYVGAPSDTFEALKVMKDGTLPHFIPARRERLLDSLSSLGTPKVKDLSTRLWGCVAIDVNQCVSCRMCATFCPTGAIAKYGEQDSEDFGVEHYPGDCVNCGTCKAICPHDAISITTTVHSSYLLGGEVHRYAMIPRAVTTNNSHQIVNTMRSYIDGDIFER